MPKKMVSATVVKEGKTKKYLCAVFFALIFLSVRYSFSIGATLLGPQQYLRTSGKPNIYNDIFAGRAGQGMLIIINGTQSGENRVSSAIVKINDVELLRAKDFNENYYSEQIPFNLLENNILSVELSGAPGSYLTITIVQEIEMVCIPGGTFMMGSNSPLALDRERPVHLVMVNSFCMGKYEVTQAEWESIMGSNPSHFKGSRLPVENVSWDDVQVFIQSLNAATGRSYRLPTEAEWEYACRAGTTEDRYGPLDLIAWYQGNSEGTTHDVGMLAPNAFGLYDILGNVWEWCSDWWDPNYYSISPSFNPQGPSSGVYKCDRGNYFGGYPVDPEGGFTASRRDYSGPWQGGGGGLGFRLVRDY